MRGLIISAFVSILLLVVTFKANSTIDFFLKIDGIEGESIDASHSKECDILAFHYELKAPVEKLGGGVASSGRQHSAIVITKTVDKASPKLFEALCKGEKIKTVVLTFKRTTTIDANDYFAIILKNVVVSSYSLTKEYTINPAGGDVLPLEDISLNFEEITFEDKINDIQYTDKWSKVK
jgi:type VI secretion system Hcp family effector